jgi:nucleoside-specific outer membrane channel protein Tsx
LPTLAFAADFNDTALTYRVGDRFTEPNRPEPITKHIPTLSHLNSGRTGVHFLSLEGRFSSNEDPKKNSTAGASEYLLTYRWQLPAGRLLDRPLALGPVRDVGLLAGIDLTKKDTLFAPRKRAWMLGPVIQLDVPGRLDIGLLHYREHNHKGIPGTPHPDIEFDGTWLLNATWAIPFHAGPLPAVFQGLLNRLGEKGKDFNDRPTTGETLLRTAVMFDVGQSMSSSPKRFMAGIGYEWWKNKYGTPPGVGTHTKTPTLHLETHF